jgi:hypothetical protein
MLPKTLPDVIRLLSGKLTLENVNAQVLEFDATSADTSIRKWTRFQSEPVEVRIAKVTNLDDPDSPSPYALAWRFEAGHVVFSNFTSLASGRHRIRAIALGGG